MDFELGIFKLKATRTGEKKDFREYDAAGWQNGTFAITRSWFLDEQNLFPVYIVSHLPTGYIIKSLKSDLPTVIAFCAALDRVCDWDFTDAALARSLTREVAPIFSEYHDFIVPADDVLPYLFLLDTGPGHSRLN